MRHAVTWSLLLILLAGAAVAKERVAEQDGLVIELEECCSPSAEPFFLEFGTTISASSSDGISGLY